MGEKMLRDAYGNIKIHLEGDLNFKHGEELKNSLKSLMKDNPHVEIHFDFSKVELVGSTGVSHFVDTIKYFVDKDNAQNIKLANVSSHFKRLFKIYDLTSLDLYMDFGLDDETTKNLNKKFGNRKYTYEN